MQYCIEDWKSWFNLDTSDTDSIFINFIIFYILRIAQNTFIIEENVVYQYKTFNYIRREQFCYNSSLDYTNLVNRSDLSSYLDYVIFAYFKYFALVAIIIISILNSYYYTNVLYGGFLLISLYFLYICSSLNKHKSNYWFILTFYNFLAIIVMILFQSPLFPCITSNRSRIYISNDECAYDLQSDNFKSIELSYMNYSTNKIEAIYMLLVNLVGLSKMNYFSLVIGNISLFTIFIITLIQKMIFEHPFSYYLENFETKDENINIKSRAFQVVLNTHLEKIREYRKIYNQLELMNLKLIRIDKKVAEYSKIWNIVDRQESLNLIQNHSDFMKFTEYTFEVLIQKIESETPGELNIKKLIESNNSIINEILSKELSFNQSVILYEDSINKEAFVNKCIETSNTKLELFSKEDYGLNKAYDVYKLAYDHYINAEPEILTYSDTLILNIVFNYNIKEITLEVVNEFKQKQLMKLNYIKDLINRSDTLSKVYLFLYSKIDEELDINLIDEDIYPNNISLLILINLIFKVIYSHIDYLLIIVVVVNTIHDGSLISLFYPILLLGFGLLDYPFPNKIFWKLLFFYSILTILLKIIYQFPIFCGDGLTLFNLFIDNYCEIYPISQNELTSSFFYLLGIRKYVGEFSYPKNIGLFHGIFTDVTIFIVLIIKRSYLRSKGIWSKIEIDNCLTSSPSFTDKQEPVKYISIIDKYLSRLIPEIFHKSDCKIYKSGKDYYPHSFASLLAIFIFSLFYYSSMSGKSGDSILDSLDKQQFSKSLLYLILFMIAIIIIDRVIYKLRYSNTQFIINMIQKEEIDNSTEMTNNALRNKVLFHYSLLIVIHSYIFIYIPIENNIIIFNNLSLQLFYVLWCVYFYFSAQQIKNGFPIITKGHTFVNSTSFYNKISFKVFRNIPFVFELRAILDWTITKTSLDLFQWFKLEDAYANLFEAKCEMDFRKKKFQGEAQEYKQKIIWGLSSYITLVFILIFPLFMFSSFNPNMSDNPTKSGNIQFNLKISNSTNQDELYSISLFQANIILKKLTKEENKEEFVLLKNRITNIEEEIHISKVQRVNMPYFSNFNWNISPPSLKNLIDNLKNNHTNCHIQINWEFDRDLPLNYKKITDNFNIELNKDEKAYLLNIANNISIGNYKNNSITLNNAFPRVLKLSNNKWKNVTIHNKGNMTDSSGLLFNLSSFGSNLNWDVYQLSHKDSLFPFLTNQKKELSFYLINEDVISSFFGINSSGGIQLSILSIYATFVYTIGRFARMVFDKISMRAIYEEMPEPEKLFELCESIYIYRNQKNLKKENQLYDLLIRIYRSPEAIIKITGSSMRYKEEKEEKIA